MLARCVLLLSLVPFAFAQGKRSKSPGHPGKHITEFPVEDGKPLVVESATARAIAGILELQEPGDQWPYEGVYREDRGQLPFGYRVGGTSITIMGLVAAPGYAKDDERVAAVDKAIAFVLDTLEVDRMQIGFQGTYDVRGWGHIYALQCLLHLQDAKLVPEGLRDKVAAKTEWLVRALVETAIPESGGWNYSRRRGYRNPRNAASPFMTAPALQALFHARARGHDVPEQVVEQALDALDRARSKQGGYAYSVPKKSRNDVADEDLRFMDRTPGAAARAAACESTLMLAGRGDPERHRRAVELFFAHWDDLAVRKSQRGTHIKPYGIAPYYFMFGHVYCAQAIEFLTDTELRERLRERMRTMLARSIEADGVWNDRQFGRSAGYGTAMALLTLHMQRLPRPHPWPAGAPKKGR